MKFLQRQGDSGEQVIVRMRGLPYSCTTEQVVRASPLVFYLYKMICQCFSIQVETCPNMSARRSSLNLATIL